MMKQKIEGILLSKIPYRERDLIGKLLLRSGKRVSVIFYGGRGGGSKMKPSLLELGHMLSVELKRSNENQELYSAKEWSVLWAAEHIRFEHQAFYLLCLMLEMAVKISLEDNLHDEHQQFDLESEGIFRVLSNGIFYLEEAVKNKDFKLGQHLPLFLGKNMLEQGIFPSLENCISCEAPLDLSGHHFLSPEQGGFQCGSCFLLAHQLPQDIGLSENEKRIYPFMARLVHLAYRDYRQLPELDALQIRELFKFFCYQFHWQLQDFLSLPFLF